MVKPREDNVNTRCAICWHSIFRKSPLLNGMKCIKFEIKKKLKFLLPPQDFKSLYDENIFSNPRICNMCFVTIKKIPRAIARLQSLVGKNINTRLYRPNRSEWDENPDSDVQNSSETKRISSSDHGNIVHSVESEGSLKQVSTSSSLSFLHSNNVTVAASHTSSNLPEKGSPPPLTEIAGACDNDAGDDEFQEDSEDHFVEEHKVSSFAEISVEKERRTRSKRDLPTSDTAKKKATSKTRKRQSQRTTVSSKLSAAKNTTRNYSMIEQEKSSDLKRPDSRKGVSLRQSRGRASVKNEREVRASAQKPSKTTGRNQTSKEILSAKDSRGRNKRTLPVRKSGKKKKIYKDENGVESDLMSDISLSDSEDEYVPPTAKVNKSKKSSKSFIDSEDDENLKPTKQKGGKQPAQKTGPHVSTKRKIENQSKTLTVKFTKLKSTVKTSKMAKVGIRKEKPETGWKEVHKVGRAELKVDIPPSLTDQSKSRLQDLAEMATKYIDSKKESVTEKLMIKCSMDRCDHSYPLWHHMAVHVKYYHYDGVLSADDDFTQKMSMLADGGKLDAELYPFKCRHKGCDLAFTCEENQQEHESVHDTDLLLFCGFPDCAKAFKLPRSLHVHYRSHTGERPYVCQVPGCEKSFKDSKDLSKHKSRHTGEKPHKCNHEGCDKAFFTVSELNSHTNTHMRSDSLCCDVCGKQYANEKGLVRHKRRIHGIGKPGRHKCPYEGCEESFVKKEKLEIHLCTHSPERRLFCEKCGKKFSCQRYLDVHYKIHIKNEKHAANPPERTIECEFAGCDKMFTTRENMKSHVLNQHRGRKPRAIPGVYFPCTVEGCGRQFSFRSTLYRHNKLVHKGGDYKLGRKVVKYICKYEGCAKEFNRKNLLEEHMVMEHGKTPKRLLPLQNKELDFIERICVHCGMVLTVTQLPRHEQIYHSEKAIRENKESPPYPCHLKDCGQIFNTREDRKVHVQDHIDNPPYKCGVGDCELIFYLEKNLDNHLWTHSRKECTCDYDGCSRTFPDQLELAKHSKVHYKNKMKCPWPNCDNWLTETGHLKPHFIAHSRSLRANLDSDFVCEICELAFNSKWGLMIHKRMHGEEAAAKPSLSRLVKFTCEEDGCRATFVDQKGFFDHFLYHYTNTPAACDYEGCSETFRNMITMSRHSKCHYDGRFRCPWQGCGKLFASVFIVKKHLYRHILSVPVIAANRQYSCNQCFMVFKMEANLASHQEHHNEKSDYVCPTCGKKGRHNHIKSHRLSNRPRKSQECQQCGARYATISGLKFHLLQKHKIGKWPFNCSYCGKGFVSSREMQRHIPSHTKEKPFVCNICGTSFASHTGHRAHMRKHTGQKYVCDVEGCDKVYTTPISLRGHKAQHAGFSKTCHYCFKTYKNPYGHKCKASRDSKKKITKPGQNPVMRPPATLPVTALLPPAQVAQAAQPPAAPSQAQISMVPATTSMQQTIIMPQQIVTNSMEVQQGARAIAAANAVLPHTHVMPQNLGQGLPPQGMSQGLQQPLPHNLPGQGMMQDRSQLGPMDMTRGGAPMDMSRPGPTMDMNGDYAFNNYVVFWDSQNMS